MRTPRGTELGIAPGASPMRPDVMRAAPLIIVAFLCASTAGAQLPEKFTIPQVMSAPFPSELVTSPHGGVAWTADAQGRKNVWVAMPPDWHGRAITPWNDDTGEEVSSPEWLPDGRALVFVRGNGTNDQGYHANAALDPRGTKQLVMYVNADGTGLRSLAEGSSPSVSPDGKTVAFERSGAIWTVPISGDSAAARRMFVTRWRDVQIRWSPRGDAIAFTSSRGDHSFVGVYHLADHRIVYLDPSVDSDAEPVWSPDGASMAFVRTESLAWLTPTRSSTRFHCSEFSGAMVPIPTLPVLSIVILVGPLAVKKRRS